MLCLVIMINAFVRLYKYDRDAAHKISNLKIVFQSLSFLFYVLANYLIVLATPENLTFAKWEYYIVWPSSVLSLLILILTLMQIADIQRT